MFLKIAYKLSRDMIFLTLFGLAIFLVAESLKPYVLTSTVSFTQIVVLLLALIFLSEFLSKKINVTNAETGSSKKAILFWLILSLALILLNLRKFNPLSAGIIGLAAVLIIYNLRKSIKES